MKDYKFDELRIALAIAGQGSVTRAAQLLQMPQPNVSRTLGSLERRLGLALFVRHRQGLIPSEFGQRFLAQAELMLEQHHALQSFSDSYKRSLQGGVTLGAPIAIHALLARHLLPALQRDMPGLILDLRTRNPSATERQYGAIFDSDCDLLISPFQPQNESLIARPLVNFRMGIFAAPAYLDRRPLTLAQAADLDGHDCITLSMLGGQRNRWQFPDAQGHLQQCEVSGVCICDNLLPAIELARQGIGLLYAPFYAVAADLQAGTLRTCLAHADGLSMNSYLIYRQRSTLPHRVQAVMEAIASQLPRILP
ncbi:LysR family transcriptional regulator [Edwardsiella piscicida]|uniref:LysR family transcriptional regulator n=1 Tax=Edwardsiella piscicida TaxID=1263550 RepID=UPI00054CB6EE|nr:LysR family transcriptional regulator [Edwardsiella piscicida]ELM3657250.1 LysR family transcriptional regulator [Edwardsiella piscicida]QBB13274.1 LysR family transcriptional regulator [Edwardsiella piscicida]UCQ13738.1 LysR family transcriptional regulator [Edwardsiella piscicida]UCQ37005.1 LysR family transcriptional regulator [Edwardsiella piscicida]UCQ40238.1 LysR family transcriptional regulator [Edwardsiella piscicida]